VQNRLLQFLQRRLVGTVLLQPVQIFQEEKPGGLFGVVKFAGSARLFAKNVINISEGLFKHGGKNLKI